MRKVEEKRGDGLEMDLLSKGGGIVLGGDEVGGEIFVSEMF